MEGTGVDSSKDLYEFICGFEVLRSDLGLISFDVKEFCFIVQFSLCFSRITRKTTGLIS